MYGESIGGTSNCGYDGVYNIVGGFNHVTSSSANVGELVFLYYCTCGNKLNRDSKETRMRLGGFELY